MRLAVPTFLPFLITVTEPVTDCFASSYASVPRTSTFGSTQWPSVTLVAGSK